MLEPVVFRGKTVILLDQRKLPGKICYARVKTAASLAKAIKDMVIRGAPAIGVAAAYGMVLGRKNIKRAAQILLKSRPTAVNLKWAVERMLKVGVQYIEPLRRVQSFEPLLKEAKKIDSENKNLCEKISTYGAALIEKNAKVMTHCNAGPLATGGIGTALGIIYKARRKIKMVYVRETRPRLQGARLTAGELRRWKIPCTLITDSAAAFIMKKSVIDSVIIGADRIAANGDVANKIGSYSLAICAKYHNVPFYVAAPYSTIDFNSKDGGKIVIEERDSGEVLKINGKNIAAAGIKAANPAFDVTPASLVAAIITEKGIIKSPDRKKMSKFYGKIRV
ncbi:MAG: S-methyl-5-thioribose-1-phosphate isomerase [bacterium]